MRRLPTLPLILLNLLVLPLQAAPLHLEPIDATIDWGQVPVVEKTLFFPGKVTHAWLNSSAHTGADHQLFKMRKCTGCHAGEEAVLGARLLAKDRSELQGKNGSLKAQMQFAHDQQYLYIRTRWPAQSGHPARMHNMIVFDGAQWRFQGGDRLRHPNNPLYEDRLSFMIDDGSIVNFDREGCFLSCHRGQRDINPANRDQTQALPVIGATGLNKSDIRKYLPESRRDGRSWNRPKSQQEIDQLKAQGQFVDLMQWRSTRSAALGYADDGYVFEYRLSDAGKSVFSWNVDRTSMTPKYMFDAEKTGFYALERSDDAHLQKQIALIEGVNTAPYDASKIKPGQLLQGRVLRQPDGSAADNDQIASHFSEGHYTVVFRRKLDTGHPEDDKIMQVGGRYGINVAIHDDAVTTRAHFVSFPFILGIGEAARTEHVDVISQALE